MRGHDVEVLTSTLPRGSTPVEHPGGPPRVGTVRVRRWPVLRDRQGAVRGYLPYLSFDVPLFARLLVAPRPDVILVEPPPTTGTVARWVGALRRIPVVYLAADIVSDAAEQAGTPSWIVGAVRRWERLAVTRAIAVLTVSHDFAARLRQWGVAEERLVVIGNGADAAVFRPEGASAGGEHPFALYAGTASDVHGPEVLVEAIARVPELHLVFLGGGTRHDALRRLGDKIAPGRVRVLPTVAPQEAAAWSRGALVSLASIAPARTQHGYPFFPAKLHAAAMCGTPIVHVGDGPGALFAHEAPLGVAVPFDADAVAEALRGALTAPASPSLRREFAEWARARVSLQAVAVRAADALERVVAPSRAARRRRGAAS
ncbi:MAG: glycosyltransferase [Actinobacteria bacterium]|nr:glycosyltransferase [Actinomycetota bacterium]MBU1609365.1 glycosyltransferase [Actinomycetota bacterium]MBU2314997.1 glycosyltransferase [Actinomycetota bacterium]MBU2385037.1 glycosyltransferase [Actinomycetota bacterium]